MELVLRSVQRPVAFERRGQTAKGTFATEIGVLGMASGYRTYFSKNLTCLSKLHRNLLVSPMSHVIII